MAEKLKVTFLSMYVRNNGEWTGKGEIYCDLLVDDFSVFNIPVGQPQKKADGETIQIGRVRAVNKEPGQSLTISGSVSERDNLDRDDSQPFEDSYTRAMNWGIGTHKRKIQNNNLDVELNYKIELQ